MTPLEEVVLAQFRNPLPNVRIKFTPLKSTDGFPLFVADLRCDDELKIKRLLVVSEANVTRRIHPQDPMNATWWTHLGDSVDDELLLATVDGVVVCYGWSSEGGEIANESSGNIFKSDYRRISYVDDLVRHPDIGWYNEIPYLLTENNCKKFWNGEPLEDVSDYSNQRHKR